MTRAGTQHKALANLEDTSQEQPLKAWHYVFRRKYADKECGGDWYTPAGALCHRSDMAADLDITQGAIARWENAQAKGHNRDEKNGV